MRTIASIIFLCFFSSCAAQEACDNCQDMPFTSYHIGNDTDLETSPTFGITMMGGRSEHDQAMKWFLRNANGGDILVLRASGSDGYNEYLFSELGVSVNSVETIVVDNEEAANHEYVIQKIQQAEAIWMAGGDQWKYLNIWGNSPMKGALNDHINIKKGVIGGTSAGMAVLGEWYFSAENGTITSDEALANPFNERLTLDNDFLDLQILKKTITDTHYANRNRQGRHSAFLARLVNSDNSRFYGIACDEYTALCIDELGIARIFGNSPQNQDAVYFIQTNCKSSFAPEEIDDNEPLTWNQDAQALIVYQVIANSGGSQLFNLNTWDEGTGGSWKYWYIENGTWHETNGEEPNCN